MPEEKGSRIRRGGVSFRVQARVRFVPSFLGVRSHPSQRDLRFGAVALIDISSYPAVLLGDCGFCEPAVIAASECAYGDGEEADCPGE